MSHGLLKMLLSTRGTLLQHTHAARCRRAEHTRDTLHKGSTLLLMPPMQQLMAQKFKF